MHRRAPPEGSFDQVVLLDRTCDMITPLCTQLSYPGLLAETCGVHAGIVSSRTLDPEGPLSKVGGTSQTCDQICASGRDV